MFSMLLIFLWLLVQTCWSYKRWIQVNQLKILVLVSRYNKDRKQNLEHRKEKRNWPTEQVRHNITCFGFKASGPKITLMILVTRKNLVPGMPVETWISHKLLRKEFLLCLILLWFLIRKASNPLLLLWA